MISLSYLDFFHTILYLIVWISIIFFEAMIVIMRRLIFSLVVRNSKKLLLYYKIEAKLQLILYFSNHKTDFLLFDIVSTVGSVIERYFEWRSLAEQQILIFLWYVKENILIFTELHS